jgi:hypothetical protein
MTTRTKMTIKFLKEFIETRKKQIDSLIEASKFTTAFNHRIAEYYQDIALAEKTIIDFRLKRILQKLKK